MQLEKVPSCQQWRTRFLSDLLWDPSILGLMTLVAEVQKKYFSLRQCSTSTL